MAGLPGGSAMPARRQSHPQQRFTKNGGATNTSNITGGSNPAPNKETNKNKQTKTNRQRLSDNRTNEHCSRATAKSNPRDTCQQTYPMKIGSPPKCNQNKPKHKTNDSLNTQAVQTTKQSKFNEAQAKTKGRNQTE